MNKLGIINIIKCIIELYINDQLTYEKYKDIIVTIKDEPYSDNAVVLNESELICLILRLVPYHKIHNFLDNLILYIQNLDKKRECNFTFLIDAYLADLVQSINYRIDSEVKAHVLDFLQRYYLNYEFDKQTILDIIQRNKMLPENNVSYYMAKEKTNQQVFEEAFTERESLKDFVSRSSYKERSRIDAEIKKLLTKIDENSFDKFVSIIQSIIDELNRINPNDAKVLTGLYSPEFTRLKQEYSGKKDKDIVRQMSLFDKNE